MSLFPVTLIVWRKVFAPGRNGWIDAILRTPGGSECVHNTVRSQTQLAIVLLKLFDVQWKPFAVY